jgi:DNA-binding transcriptional regulator YhcF (GntR family)
MYICLMKLSLDSASSVPLFHQLAEALRFRIAVGALPDGERLPGVREAAALWRVHFHTVRRAYRTLSGEGLLHMGPGKPTTVTCRPTKPVGEDLCAFLSGILREGRERFGLSPSELGRRLDAMNTLAEPSRPVHMVECSEEQARDHALEINVRWGIEVKPWVLDNPGEPPPGLIVATFFHFQELRNRWPRRQGHIHFVAIQPDPCLPEQVCTRLGRKPSRVLLWEQDETMAENVAADLRSVFQPCRIIVEPRVMREGRSPMRGLGAKEACLFAPRVWGRLPSKARAHPRAFEATYKIRHGDLEGLGPVLNERF